MAVITQAQASLTGVANGRPSSHAEVVTEGRTEGMARLSTESIFQARSTATTHDVLAHVERRERIILILLDGRRTIGDVARLLHRSEIEVAHVLARLLKRDYIEYIGTRTQFS